MFEFEMQPIKLQQVLMPMENHDKELKMGIVLKCVGIFPATILQLFSAGLRDSLYRLPTEEEKADLATDTSEPCMLRHPKMSPFTWDYESEGYEAILDYGLGGDSDLKFVDTKVRKFEITPLEGAIVQIKFNLNCHPDQKDVGALGAKQKQEISMQLTAPSANKAQGDLLSPPRKSKKEKNAEALAAAQDAFVSTAE